MKHTYGALSLLLVASGLSFCAQEQKGFTHKSYSQEDLVAVRVAWAFREEPLRQLMFEAKEYAKNTPVHYVVDAGFVASIDGAKETITTPINPEKNIELSYADFKQLLRDKTILEAANKVLKERYERARLSKK